MFDWLGIVWGWIEGVLSWAWGWLDWIWANLKGLAQWTGEQLQTLWNGVGWVARKFWDGLKALRHLNFSKIWAKINAGYKRFHDALEWYKKHVQEPMDRMRRQVWGVYRTIFKPILDVLDTFRSMIRPLAIFNRKLAARLDHYLMGLEGKLMWPVTATLHRLNAISSYFTVIITTAGRLARPLLLESMRRDALLVWEVLTNPRQAIYSPPERVGPPSLPSVEHDFREYLEQATGPYTMHEAEARDALRQGFEEAA